MHPFYDISMTMENLGFNFESLKTYVSFALLVEILFDEKCSNRISQISVDVCHAELPSGRSLFSTVESSIKFLLSFQEPGVQVVDAVANETPQNVVGNCSKNKKFLLIKS